MNGCWRGRAVQALASILVFAPTVASAAPLAAAAGQSDEPGAAATAVSRPVPAPVKRVPPRYPRLAQFQAVQGRVKVCFTVTAEGRVEGARVEAVPDSAIDEIPIRRKIRADFRKASLAAIRQWTFAPRLVDGRPVTTPNVCQTLQFRLR